MSEKLGVCDGDRATLHKHYAGFCENWRPAISAEPAYVAMRTRPEYVKEILDKIRDVDAKVMAVGNTLADWIGKVDSRIHPHLSKDELGNAVTAHMAAADDFLELTKKLRPRTKSQKARRRDRKKS